jgi:predicted secreted protein
MMMKKKAIAALLSIASLGVASGVSGVAGAQGLLPPPKNVIELGAEAQREVTNDLMVATLFVEQNDSNPAALANSLNKTIADALRLAKDVSVVKTRTGNNQTYPLYNRNNQAQGWRGRAELRLETKDFAAGSALIGKLQSSMQLGGINFAVSPEARRAAENELISEALAAFRERATIAQRALGGRSYKVQRVGINTGYSGPQPKVMMMQARGAAMAESVQAPAVEGGTSNVTVSVSGAVEYE